MDCNINMMAVGYDDLEAAIILFNNSANTLCNRPRALLISPCNGVTNPAWRNRPIMCRVSLVITENVEQ